MAIHECPRCGLISDRDAQACDCGYEFATGTVRERPVAPPPSDLGKGEVEGASRLEGVADKRRYFAMGIDATIASALGLLSGSVLPMSDRGRMGAAVCVYLLYFFLQEGAWSTTLGKRLFSLRVMRVDGADPSWGEAAIRTAARLLEVNPIMPFGALPGALAVAFSKRRQRLGDMLAKTVVCPR